jgi:hypothetical protein
VVVNTALMDNHQQARGVLSPSSFAPSCPMVQRALRRAPPAQELAEALAQRGHLAYCAPEQLAAAFAALRPAALVPYAPGDAAPIARAIDALCGV